MHDFVLKRLLSLPDKLGMDILNLDNTLCQTAAPLISLSLLHCSNSHCPQVTFLKTGSAHWLPLLTREMETGSILPIIALFLLPPS